MTDPKWAPLIGKTIENIEEFDVEETYGGDRTYNTHVQAIRITTTDGLIVKVSSDCHCCGCCYTSRELTVAA